MTSAALLLTGGTTALGTALLAAAREAGRLVPMARAADRRELDLVDPFGTRDAVRAWARAVTADGRSSGVPHRPVVVNLDAWTDADSAEREPDAAYARNAAGPAVLAAACAEVGVRLLHVSTGDVFSGPGPHEVDEAPAPVSALGRTRLAGEQAVREIHPGGTWVVRTGWVYGPAPTDVVGAAAAVALGDEPVIAFDDQRGSPTWAGDLGPALLALALSEAAPGLLHAASTGSASWFELTREVIAVRGGDPERVRATEAFALDAAPRPGDASLGTASWAAAGLPELPDWRDGLRRALAG